ncbi:MAG: hypothetical protein HRT47_03370 [Candidatus Caenarcaniphilales bacterium]|nr:hypothetical protein [Candidatus Caenarcaniphilales bacterium]
MTKRDLLKAQLKETSEQLNSANQIFIRTYDEVKNLDLSKYEKITDINWETLKDIETLTARFARLSDIFVQKFLRLIDTLELTNEGSIIDRINRAEKRGLIKSAESSLAMRDLRNDISHDYLPDELMKIYAEVIKFSPELIDSCNSGIQYAQDLV